MKFLTLIIFALAGGRVSAYPCPASLAASEDAKAIQNWMGRYQGQRELGGCHVEITACDPAAAPGESQVLGEVYVVDDRGREAYLPLIVAAAEDKKIKTSLESHRKSFFYIKYDYYFEDELGRTEAYRLDLHADNQGRLKALALGAYATRKKLHMANGNESRWYSCGG